MPDHEAQADGEGEYVSNLENTIDRIGMGRYQKALLILCGFGWLTDNMWLEAVAIILPRVQDHYGVTDGSIGWLSTSMFFGMMIGAVGWGTCSDLMGRTLAFNGTLLFTGIFGFFASFIAFGFKSLCVAMFFLGTAIGGSMPTDGTLFMENIPRKKQHLLVALSLFFSLGAVLAAVIGLIVLPGNSCPPKPATCDVQSQNSGWKQLLSALSAITIAMFVGRFIFFTLRESPRYLVNTGRPAEAVQSLQHIATYNGKSFKITLLDVQECASVNDVILEDDEAPQSPEATGLTESPATSYFGLPGYRSTGTDSPRLSRDYDFRTPAPTPRGTLSRPPETPRARSATVFALPPSPLLSPKLSYRQPLRHSRTMSSMSAISVKSAFSERVVEAMTSPLQGWTEKTLALLDPDQRRQTLLIWAVWFLMSLAYTMFNVFLPKLLEGRMDKTVAGGRTRALWEVVIFTLGGCPGALLGAWMVGTRLGRRKSLALTTFLTAVFCIAFCQVTTEAAVHVTSISISLAATTMWAILYGMTPEIFEPNVRGTACGTASALNRIGGMIAPLVGGNILVISDTLPMYGAAGLLTLASVCVLFLPLQPQRTGEAYYQLSH